MTTHTHQKSKRKNRSRMRPEKTTGRITETNQDAIGFSEPISRYVDLPSNILGLFYNVLNGKPERSRYYLERYADLIHEAQDFPDDRKLIHRPAYQHRHGMNHPAIYRKSPGTELLLFRKGIRDALTIRWINNTHLMSIEEGGAPSIHDQQLAIFAASIEITARKHKGFITHIDILKKASEEAHNADSPLSIPVRALKHQFADQARPQEIALTHVKPDCIFGVPVANGGKFFALEYDRHTEDMEPTKSLTRMSWLKKILMYSAISTGKHPAYETYLGLPNLRVLAVFQGPTRQANFNKLVLKHARMPNLFASTVAPPIDFIMTPRILPEFYNEAVWMKANGTRFSLKEEVV